MSLETFPDDIGATATAGPMFNTDVIELDSGNESRNANWAAAKWKGEATIPAREVEKGQRFVAFLRAVAAGMFGKFRVRDWIDFQVPDGSGVGIFAMIDATHFQAYKRYTFGSATHERKITRLRGTPTVTGGTTPVWDLDTGILTVASGTPTAWAGYFDVPARLDDDGVKYHMVGQSAAKRPIIEWDSIPLIEVRE